MKATVGSANPVKVAAAEEVLRRAYGSCQVEGREVAADLPAQPWGDWETRAGAVARAWAALRAGEADLGIGFEGGLQETERGLMTCAWAAVVDRQGRLGVGGSVGLLLPPEVARTVRQGAELGEAMDRWTGKQDTKRRMGAVGILTGGLLDRQQAYEQILTFALVRLLQAAWFDGEEAPAWEARPDEPDPSPGRPVLVSGCLLGLNCRYDGGHCLDPRLVQWAARGRVIPICPEVAGGLSIPRPLAEIQGGPAEAILTGRAVIRNVEGQDVTAPYLAGAKAALALARRVGARVAILKERSPSCGSHVVYDGTFQRRLIPGQGLTALALRSAGLQVFSEEDWDEALFHKR
jgi:inosine/xanthosine triphosphatase